jgi:hypothetical protein
MSTGSPETTPIAPQPIDVEALAARPRPEIVDELAADAASFDAALDYLRDNKDAPDTLEQQKLRNAVELPIPLPEKVEKPRKLSKEEADRLFSGQWQRWQDAAYGNYQNFEDALTTKREVVLKLRRRKPGAPAPDPSDPEDTAKHTFVYNTLSLPPGTSLDAAVVARYESVYSQIGVGAVTAEPVEKITPSVVASMRELIHDHPEMAGRLRAKLAEAHAIAGKHKKSDDARKALEKKQTQRADAEAEAAWAAEMLDSGELSPGARKVHHRNLRKQTDRYKLSESFQTDIRQALNDRMAGKQPFRRTSAFLTERRETQLKNDDANASYESVRQEIAANNALWEAETQEGFVKKNQQSAERLGEMYDMVSDVMAPPDPVRVWEVPDRAVKEIAHTLEGVVWGDRAEHDLYVHEHRLDTHIQRIKQEIAQYEDPSDIAHQLYSPRHRGLMMRRDEAVELRLEVAFLHKQGQGWNTAFDTAGKPDYEGRWAVSFQEDGGIVTHAEAEGRLTRVVLYPDASIDQGEGRFDMFGNPVTTRREEVVEEEVSGEDVVHALGRVLPEARERGSSEIPAEGTPEFEALRDRSIDSFEEWWYHQTDPSLAAIARRDTIEYGEAVEQARETHLRELHHMIYVDKNHDATVIGDKHDQLAEVTRHATIVKYEELYLTNGVGENPAQLLQDGSMVARTTLYGETGTWRVWPDGTSQLDGGPIRQPAGWAADSV